MIKVGYKLNNLECLKILNEKQQKVIKMRLGIDCVALSLENIAKQIEKDSDYKCSMSSERVRQIEWMSLLKLYTNNKDNISPGELATHKIFKRMQEK